MTTLSERIGELATRADELVTDLKRLCKEVRNRDDVDGVEYLADVPEELERALANAGRAYEFLESAETCATKGGE